jgi:hypothetical protein
MEKDTEKLANFEKELNALLAKYNYTLSPVIQIVDRTKPLTENKDEKQ